LAEGTRPVPYPQEQEITRMTDQTPERDPDAEVAVPGPPELLAVPADTSYEIELDERPQAPAAPVYADISPPEGAKLPIIPAHLQSLDGLKAAGKRHAGRQAHRAGYHGVRAPKYLLLALCWAVIGVFRLAGRQGYWWWHLEAHGLKTQAAASGDSREYMKLHKETKEVRKVRGGILAGEVLAIGIAVVILVRYAPWYAWGAVAALALPALARAGRPADKPIVTPAEVTPRFRVLNADIVLRAYYAAGLGSPDKAGQQIQFGSRMSRDGDGTRCVVDLPYGKGLKDAVKVKDEIASGLDVTESQVFLRRDPTSYRRHTLWVADRDPLAVPVGRTPLLACKQTDIWRPAPIGLDERGQLVTVPLMWNSLLVSALPRAGKTFAARLVTLYAALDPYCKLDVFDAKGSPDWRKFALVADSFAFGLTPAREGLPPEILLRTLEGLKRDAQDRYTRLSEMPTDVCPEGKLTREIARDPRFRMPVRVVVLEEFQEYFELGDISKDIAALLVFLIKVAPGAGIILLCSTQKPSGIGGGGELGQRFTSFRDNFSTRFGLRTSSWQVSEMCLGQGAYSEGLDTSTLLPQYKGVGILRGASDASPTVRTYLADGQDAEKILTAARALRSRAGTLSGMAAGDDGAPQRDVLADVLAVLGTDAGVHWAVLAERLAKRFPDRWADATGDAISAQLRSLGVASVVVKTAGQSLRGCRREDVQRAAGRL
jgi:S-DNA-T family DNA segregation ATPase FtsK/SpoIIIE